jgi:thioredoxin reductase (NADPH)
MTNSEHKLIIIGSGSAGYSAAIYASRANLNPILITGNDIGGQLMMTTDVENYPGISEIMGPELMEKMRLHAEKFDVKIIYDHIKKMEVQKKNGINHFILHGSSENRIYKASSAIIATGASAKWLGIPNEEKFLGYGVSGCATCDGFFFKNKVVAIVGGGNTAVEEALFLTKFASKVYLIHRRNSLRAEKILQDRLTANPKVEFLWNRVVDDILGEEDPVKRVTHLRLKLTDGSNRQEDLSVDGVFIAIGHKPNSDIFKGIVEIDSNGYIITKAKSTETSVDGVFAAGDIQDSVYRQAITSAGTGCMAALDAEKYLEKLEDSVKNLHEGKSFHDIAGIGNIIENNSLNIKNNILEE